MAQRFGRFWLHEKIGQGGMAEIFRATIGPDPTTYAFDIALKRLHAPGVPDIFWAQSPDYAIREELAPQPGDTVIQKTTFGAFNSSTIDATLRAMGKDTLIVSGISTNACVETTARDAADRGFATAIVDECTADFDPQAHDAALRGFHFNFGRVIPTARDAVAAIEDGVTL